MRLRIEVLDGAREGVRRTFDAARVTLGRHPDSDLQLDPEEDRAVSTRHAALLQAGGRWLVRDMGSRNGTWVGREEVTGDRRLRDGDVLRLGRQGPRLRVEMVADDAGSPGGAGAADGDREARDESGSGAGLVALGAVLTAAAGLGAAYLLLNGLPGGGSDPGSGPPGAADSAAAATRPAGVAGAGSPSGVAAPAGTASTDGAAADDTARASASADGAAAGTSSGPDTAAGPTAAPGSTAASGSEADPGSTAAPRDGRTDSALRATRRTLDSLRGKVSGLQEALQTSRREVAEIRERLRRAERQDGAEGSSGGERPRELRRRLDSAQADLERQSALAEADFADVEERHWRAVARVFVQGSDGEVAAATAFAVRAGGLLITSRHVVLEPDGEPVPRIGVQFARSDQVWPGELVATTDAADLALVRALNVQGDVPTVAELGGEGRAVETGSPVAVLGYSEGPTSSMGESGRLARPGLSTGLLVERGEELLRVRGFGAEGGSGSPIFDEDGRLVGVLQGGVEGDGGGVGAAGPGEERILVAVPASRVRSFIASVMERLER